MFRMSPHGPRACSLVVSPAVGGLFCGEPEACQFSGKGAGGVHDGVDLLVVIVIVVVVVFG